MRKILFIIAFGTSVLTSCTKNNFIKSGISIGRFDGSLLEYMEHPGHSYDWDSTALMVRQAGEEMVRLFEGQDPNHPEITFFGPTNHSIRRYMLEKKIERVSDMDPDWCKETLLRHICDGKIYRDNVPEGKGGNSVSIVEGGQKYTTLAGNVLWLYTTRGSYGNVEETGAVKLNMYGMKLNGTGKMINIASTNIEPDNCVVHSLTYDYTIGKDL